MSEKDLLIIKGFIKEISEYNTGDGLFVGEEPLALQMQDLTNQKVTVSFYISEIEKDLPELKENHILTISGYLEADYSDIYSEYTGYLWTDEELKIGNHDLLEDLRGHIGKFAFIVININP